MKGADSERLAQLSFGSLFEGRDEIGEALTQSIAYLCDLDQV